MARKILVLGATGTVGGMVTELLARQGEQVRAASRRPAAAAAAAALPVEWVEFDYERPETFGPALTGIDRALLIARPGDDAPEQAVELLIGEMRRQGTQRVVDLTAMGTELRPDFGLRKAELLLEASGLAFTHVRPNWFMQIFSSGPLAAGIKRHRAIRVPAADAQISFIDAADVAAVCAAALAEDAHAGAAYTITGGEPLSHGDVARTIGQAAGIGVQYLPASDEDARQAVQAAGLPPARGDRLVNFYRLVRAGLCRPVSPAVAEILGRPPVTFAEFASRQAATGCWS